MFAAKMWVAFAMQNLLTFFQQKISMYLPYFKIDILTSQDRHFNLMLANNFVKFEQLGPECQANSIDPDQMPCSAASDLALHFLLRSVCPNA